MGTSRIESHSTRGSGVRSLRVLAAVLLLAASGVLIPASPAFGAIEYTIYHIPTSDPNDDNAMLRIEVTRDTQFDPQPVILTYSPYNTLSEPEPADDGIATRYRPRGFARAKADLLGTRGSGGCWDYGGNREITSGIDVVKFLAAQPWSTGKVAMIGGSYEGTTANMVAARGPEVPELVGIVPISSISHWYGYAFQNGVRYFLNSRTFTDEGFDTPAAFDFGFNRTLAPDPSNAIQTFQWDMLHSGTCEFDSISHTENGYNRFPDYDAFWLERDYRKETGITSSTNFRAAVLMAHGWQDYNVKQEEAIVLWDKIPVDNPNTGEVEGVPFKRLYMTQGTHGGGTSGAEWLPLQDRFFDHVLKGVQNGINTEPNISITRGRALTAAGAYETLPPKFETDFPPPNTRNLTLYLRRHSVPGSVPNDVGELLPQSGNDGVWTYTDTATATEEDSIRDPNRGATGLKNWFYYTSPVLARDARMTGAALLDFWVQTMSPPQNPQHLTPILLDIAPNGTIQQVARGFMHLAYRNGLAMSDPMDIGEWGHGILDLLPQDHTFRKDHRIGLLLQSSNTVWAVPGSGGPVNVAHGPVTGVTSFGTRLVLPIVIRTSRRMSVVPASILFN
ncbi:MAG TPA: CocE/NonD family hydrolase [Actinomycetota bacterium]|nr:CocE/NonD family hydrolase [Actinomycetota bacterium]